MFPNIKEENGKPYLQLPSGEWKALEPAMMESSIIKLLEWLSKGGGHKQCWTGDGAGGWDNPIINNDFPENVSSEDLLKIYKNEYQSQD